MAKRKGKAAFETSIEPVFPGDGYGHFDDQGSDHERASRILREAVSP